MPHRRSQYAEERALIRAYAFYCQEERELVATFGLNHFEQGEILADSRGRGTLQR